LTDEPSVVNAFKRLQKLHDLWREIGPVPADLRTATWERFKDATTKINKRHQEHFVNLKKEQKQNLEKKIVLCEKVEAINTDEISNHKEWEKMSAEVIGFQREWKKIGFAPKKDNNKIYQHFREACDKFFDGKRDFYARHREIQHQNLQTKVELCEKAEELQDSTDWKATTDELIALQKQWKEAGPVPFRQSEKVWKRFRAACDKFFENKSHHFSNIDSSYSDNLEKKEDLIKRINEYKLVDKVDENMARLREFQDEWASIGFVPYKQKDIIQQKYRAAINKHFDKLKVDDARKNILKYKNKLNNLSNKPNSNHRMYQEREKFISQMKQLENDIVLWENNKGFFARSKRAEAMVREVEQKIDDAKKKIELLSEKIRLIDDMDE